MDGQYVAYTFFRLDPAWRRLPVEERAAAKEAFADVVAEHAERFDHLRAYSTTGVRPDVDFFFWKITPRYEDLGELGAALNATPLAGWLETPYSYLATTKASQYTSARKPRRIVPQGAAVPRRLSVREGAALVLADRGGAPGRDGRAHPDRPRRVPEAIHNHTTYSFGIDDQEFMTVVRVRRAGRLHAPDAALRDSEASTYTERDTPIFVGQHLPIRETLDRLDGVGSGSLADAR